MIGYINETIVRARRESMHDRAYQRNFCKGKDKSMHDKTYQPIRNEKEATLTAKTN